VVNSKLKKRDDEKMSTKPVAGGKVKGIKKRGARGDGRGCEGGGRSGINHQKPAVSFRAHKGETANG